MDRISGLDDERDVYLGRCLKNWAASQAPQAGDRECLLHAAALNKQDGQVNSRSHVKNKPLRGNLPPYHVLHQPGNFSPIKFWPLYLNTFELMRFAQL